MSIAHPPASAKPWEDLTASEQRQRIDALFDLLYRVRAGERMPADAEAVYGDGGVAFVAALAGQG